MRLRTVSVIALCALAVGCGSQDDKVPASSSTSNAGGMSTAPGGAGGMGGAVNVGGGGDAGMGGSGGDEPTVVETARCGLAFEWLPATSVGEVVSEDTPHSSLTVAEALVSKLVLQTQGLDFDRDPTYDTLAHRIVYTTQDRGVVREATSLVIVPQVAQAESFPVILFHHGTTGLNDTCAPTFGWEDTESDAYGVALLLSLFSSLGYIVVAPDYLGQKSTGAASPELHPYLIGEPTAVAVWDAARAAKRLLTGDGSSAEFGAVALWGISQGGHAAMFTAMYHPFYAPEMDLRTGVYTVPPSHLEAHMTLGTRDFRSSSGNTVLFYAAADSWYQPELSPGLDQIFISPYDEQVPQDVAASCRPDTFDNVSTVQEVFTPEVIAASLSSSLTGYEPWGCFMRENSVPSSSLPTPSIPGLMVLGEDDTLVWSGIERESFETLCSQGHALSFLECAGADHGEAFLWSIDDTFDYIDARLDGDPVQGGCVLTAAQTCSNTP